MTRSAHTPDASTGVVELNHTAIYAKDKHASAKFLAEILGLQVGAPFGPFVPVDTTNGVTLDFYEHAEFAGIPQHYAFLVSESAFDGMIDRLEAAGVVYYADPQHTQPGRINGMFGGKGAYFEDLNGHNMEIMTRPYIRP